VSSVGLILVTSAVVMAIVLVIIGYVLGSRFSYTNKLSSKNSKHYEEVAEKGRQQLEATIAEHVTFLQNDLRMTVSGMNGYMKEELGRTLQDEMKRYDISLAEMRKAAAAVVTQSQHRTEQQYKELKDQLAKSLMDEKQRRVHQLEENMTDIVSYYIQAAVGKRLELREQIPFIVADLQAEKASIIEDIKYGA